MSSLCLTLCSLTGCAHTPPSAATSTTQAPPVTPAVQTAKVSEFIAQRVKPWPPEQGPHLLATSDANERVSSYDNALLVLHWLRIGERARAAQVLCALAELQYEDGSVPFSFPWPKPENAGYVRSGATAWVGYAAVEYLDADRAGPSREVIARLAHRAAEYLLARQVNISGDHRDGLVLGGFGTYRYEPGADGGMAERWVPGPIPWASTEHNIDAFFFLRDFARLTGEERFARAADRIRTGLTARGWAAASGQFIRGFTAEALDGWHALDCASWGALLLQAAKDPLRAETALASADVRYASRAPEYGATGHRPYAHAPVFENRALAEHMRKRLPASEWNAIQAVWAEGSAGVALAALRLGRVERARAILDELEKLRAPNGALPTFTVEIPSELDTQPSLAGTLWVELVRFELARGAERPTLWRPQ